VPSSLRAQKAVMFRRLADAVERQPVVETYLVWMKEDGSSSPGAGCKWLFARLYGPTGPFFHLSVHLPV
jgi:hypothetical protein